ADTKSFASALRHVLRQDPDVILVGEMRDLETISTAITAAETGHLVFATLHGVVTQQLLPNFNTTGRVVASEVMVSTPAIRNLIREAKVHQIYSAMQAGAKHGMVTMDSSLAALANQG